MTDNEKFFAVLFSVCCLIVCFFWLGWHVAGKGMVAQWCEQVHEGQMQGEFCITPENVAVPRPEWSK